MSSIHNLGNGEMSLRCAVVCFWKHVNCRLGIPRLDCRVKMAALLVDVGCG